MSTEGDVSRERAAKDMAHIAELMKNVAFNDYFMRRLTQKIQAGENSVLNDDLSPERREAVRQQVKAWKEIRLWVSEQEIASCQLQASQS